jgi:hypothetical protein
LLFSLLFILLNREVKTVKECIQIIRHLPNTPQNIPQIQQVWANIKCNKFKLDPIDYTQLLKFCHSSLHSSLGHDILSHIQTNLPHNKVDIILKTAIVNMLVKCGESGMAVSLWDETLPADGIMYTSFIMGCTSANRYVFNKQTIN